jgi:hypothetical protein
MADFNPTPNGRPAAFQFAPAADRGHGARHRGNGAFGAAEETALAQALLAAANTAELKRVLRALIEKAWGARQPTRPQVKSALVQLLEAAGEKLFAALSGAVAAKRTGDAGKLGSLVKHALNMQTLGATPLSRNLERSRRFVRLAAKAAVAAASPPPDVDPISHAQKLLSAWANQSLLRSSATVGDPMAAAKTISAVGAAPRRSQGTTSGGKCASTACARSPGACQCGQNSRNGHWVRRGGSIIIEF